MSSDWTDWLDRLAADLTAQRTALAQGRPDAVVGGEPPGDLGPLPAALQARAAALLRENELLTDELAAACATHGRRLEALTARQSHSLQSSSPVARFFDARG